jgi:NADH-quinone oxidoreductase subunit E
MLLETHKSEIDTLLSQYADRRSVVLPLLYIAQDTYGYLSNEAIAEVATILDLPTTDVFEVVGFYTLFYNHPVGKWMLQVCDDVPCCYCGAEELIDTLKKKLNIREEETTADGMFTLQRVKCLAACDRAPMLQANLEYVYDVTPERVDALLDDLRARADRGEPLSVSGRAAEDYEWEDTTLKQIARKLGEMPAGPLDQVAPEPKKAAAEEAAGVPAEPAQEAAEAQAEAESPVEPSPDAAPAGAHPDPEQKDEQGVLPPNPAQRETPEEK